MSLLLVPIRFAFLLFPAFPNISFVYLNWLPQHCALYCGIVVCRMAEREREREGSLHPSLILDGQTRNQFRFCSHGRTTAEWMYARLTDRVYERCAMPKPPPPSATHKEMEDGGRQREILCLVPENGKIITLPKSFPYFGWYPQVHM